MQRPTLVLALLVFALALSARASTPPPPLRGLAYVPSATFTAILSRAAKLFNDRFNESAYFVQRPYPETFSEYQAIVSGTGVTDIVPLYNGAGRVSLMADGSLHDLTAAWESTNLAAKVFPSLVPSVTNEAGVPFAVPIFATQSVCSFRVSVFDSLGLAAPSTWDDLVHLLDSLESAGLEPLAAGFNHLSPTDLFDRLAITMHGDAWYRTFINAEVPFTDPKVRTVFDVFVESRIPWAYSKDPSTGLLKTVSTHASEFVNGRIGIACGLQLFDELLLMSGVPIDDIGTFIVPPYSGPASTVAPGEPNAGVTGASISLSVPMASPESARALDFVGFMADLDNQAAIWEAAKFAVPLYTPLKSVVKDNATRVAFDALRSASSLHDLPWVTEFGYPALYRKWSDVVLRLLTAPDPAAAATVLDNGLRELEAERLSAVFHRAVAPDILPGPGLYSEPATLTMRSPTTGALILYTLDGTQPGRTSPGYDAPITLGVSGTYTVRAIATAPGLLDSAESTITLTIALPAQREADSNTTVILAIVLPLIAVLLCTIFAVGYVIHRRRTVVHKLSSDGDIVIPYESLDVASLIGQGSFGAVYKGRWRGSPVAIKQAHADLLTSKQIKEFVSEAQMLLKIRHPNIVILMAVTTQPPALVTEFCDRGALYDVLHDPALFLDPSILHKWAHQMASGLQFLEGSNVVHGDFKSLNVLLDSSFTAKLADFGLAAFTAKASASGKSGKHHRKCKRKSDSKTSSKRSLGGRNAVSPMGSAASSLTMLGSGASTGSAFSSNLTGGSARDVGTVFWSAPELLEYGAMALSSATDAYALGITLWELATRADLYPGLPPMSVAFRVVHEGLRPDTTAIAPAFQPMVDLAVRLWARDPADRLSLSDAELALAGMYDLANVVVPVPLKAPVGQVWALRCRVPGLEDWLRLAPKDACDALDAFHAGAATASDKTASILSWDLDEVTLSTHSPSALFTLAERLFAALSTTVPFVMVAAVGDVGSLEAPRPDGRAMADGAVLLELDALFDRLNESNEPGTLVFGPEILAEADRLGKDATQVAQHPGLHQIRFGIALPVPSTATLSGLTADVWTASLGDESVHSSPLDSAARPSKAGSPLSGLGPLLPHTTVAALLDAPSTQFLHLGTYARVYRANAGAPNGSSSNDSVVLKVLLKQNHTAAELVSIVRAVAVAMTAGVKASCLVPPLGVCVSPGRVTIALPFVPGGSLLDRLQTGPTLSQPERHALLLNVATGLSELRSRMPTGQGHGALRPSNVLLAGAAPFQHALLVDYGVSDIRISMASMTMSPTAAYSAPEEMRGVLGTSPADVFVFGSLIYETLTGEQAFTGQNALEISMKILNGATPELDARVFTPAVKDIITSCWASAPEARVALNDLISAINSTTDLDW